MKRVLPALILLLLAEPCPADEGMWTFDNFPRKAVRERHGFEATDEWLARVRLASARLAGGCSGSFVSPDGLVMTNHHCASDCIQQISTAEKDLTRTGFYAPSRAEEAICPEIEVNQLVAVEDVTARLQAATRGLDDKEFNRAQKAEMSRIEKACAEDGRWRCDVVTLYHGGRHHLYKYKQYRDVRLVFAPEIQVAFFGGDPDNFMFPRYNLDVSFLRVYEDGRPARTPDHFAWSASGAKEGELVFVPGHPGTTDRLLTVAQLESLRDVRIPGTLLRLAQMRGMLTQFGKESPEKLRTSLDALLGVENAYKNYRGELEALLDKDLFARKIREEQDLRARIAADPEKQGLYGGAWDEIAKAQAVRKRIYKPYSLIERSGGFSSDLYRTARALVRGAAERRKPNEERLREFRDSALPSLEQSLFSTAPIYPDLEMLTLEFSLTKLREDLGPDDPFVKKVLERRSPEEMARALVTGTRLAAVEERKRLWEGGAAAVEASDDPMIRLARDVDPDARAVRKIYEDEVEAVEKKNSELISKAMFEAHGTDAYPDATFTLRLSYGTVRGWEENGRTIPPITTFEGLFDRATGRDPFALPQRWLDARPRLDMATPMNFSNDCDIVGGNSGSPVVNRAAEIVGLIFDGNIHSLGGSFWFDGSLNRAVAVHSAALTEALGKVYGADGLLKELGAGGARR